MGIDVYLRWDGMPEEEKAKQCTGGGINAGDVGYLRARGGDREETVLRTVFPGSWEGNMHYDFSEKKFHELKKIGYYYLTTAVLEQRFDPAVNSESALEKSNSLINGVMHSTLYDMLYPGLEFPAAVTWLNSLFNFFKLGMKKQEEGKNPRAEISW